MGVVGHRLTTAAGIAGLLLVAAPGCVDRALYLGHEGSGAGGQDDGALDDGSSGDDGDEAEDVGGNPPTVPPCVPGADTDCDGDGVPDGEDPFPDGDDPPPSSSSVIYANTPDALYTYDPSDYAIVEVGAFSFEDGIGEPITDIAIDRNGYLYAVGTSTLYACDPQTVVCTALDAVPGANAAGFVPTDAGDVLLLAGFDGTVWRVDFEGTSATAVEIGNLEIGGSSGDIAGSLAVTVASVDQHDGSERVRPVDPADGHVIGPAYPLPSFDNAWGLAFFDEVLYAFTPSGSIIFFDDANVDHHTGLEFWGAASFPDW